MKQIMTPKGKASKSNESLLECEAFWFFSFLCPPHTFLIAVIMCERKVSLAYYPLHWSTSRLYLFTASSVWLGSSRHLHQGHGHFPSFWWLSSVLFCLCVCFFLFWFGVWTVSLSWQTALLKHPHPTPPHPTPSPFTVCRFDALH